MKMALRKAGKTSSTIRMTPQQRSESVILPELEQLASEHLPGSCLK